MKGNFHARFLGGCGRVNRLHLPGPLHDMSSPETIKVIGYVLYGISIFALIVWSAATMGYWPDLRDKEARSSWEMHKKYSPLWWLRFSR